MRTAPQIRTSLVPVDGWVKFNCARCKRELWKTPYEAKKKIHYCSKECRNETPEIRLMKSFVRRDGSDPTQCWIWTKKVNHSGYGMLKANKKTVMAHRLSWEMHRGPIPEGMLALHKCIGTPSCINPDHLYLGDQKQNIDDCIRQGRKVVLRGEDHASSVLTEDAVREIRPLKGIVSSEELAIRFGCSKSAIHGVWYGQNWKHVK